jgi:hypothetical protein
VVEGILQQVDHMAMIPRGLYPQKPGLTYMRTTSLALDSNDMSVAQPCTKVKVKRTDRECPAPGENEPAQ